MQGLLKSPVSAFAPPSDDTKKSFETKTAPINVPSGPDSRFDIDTIKKDAEWLSKTAKLNLVAALRIVVVEHQSRPARHLMGSLSSQDATNLQEAAGLINGQGSAFVSDLGAAAALDAEEIWTDFEKPETKQRRIFDTYLTERRYFMLAADYAHSILLYKRLPTFAQVEGDISETFQLKTPSREDSEALLPAYFDVLIASMRSVEAGFKEVTEEDWVTDDVELNWLRTLLTEAVHALSVAFQVIDSFGDEFAPAGSVSQWFSLMGIYNFFDAVQPVCISPVSMIPPY